MVREVVLLSDVDLDILKFISEEKFIKDIFYCFDMNYTMINRHLGRLRKLNAFNEIKFGTFKKIKINKKGSNILNLINSK